MAAPPRAMTDAERWYRERYSATPEREAPFTTISGEPVAPLYTEDDLPDSAEIGLPGEFPFTRGVYPSMYRGRAAGRIWARELRDTYGARSERSLLMRTHSQTAGPTPSPTSPPSTTTAC